MIAADQTPSDHYRDAEPRPGRFSRNGRPRSLLGPRFGPPADEGAWARRLAEIRAEREVTASLGACARSRPPPTATWPATSAAT